MSNSTHETHPETQLLSVRAVAERLDVSTDTVRRLVATGQLPAIRIGVGVRVSASDFAVFVQRQKERSKGPDDHGDRR